MKKCVVVSLLIFFIICICSSISSATDLGGAVSSATSLEWTVSSGTNLSTLRLNREGLSPEFNKDIKEYFDYEIEFSKMMSDINKIIGDAIKEVL